MRKTFLLAAALLASTTAASAENWVHADRYALYDADSAYVEGGLIYVTLCNSTKCANGDASNDATPNRFDCDAGTDSAFVENIWQPPSHQGDGPDDFASGSTADMVMRAVCAQKASLPSR